MRRLIIVTLVLIISALFLLSSNRFTRYVFKEKIWKHRVNSIEKLRTTFRDYRGIELDIVFYQDPDRFEIHHPPEPSAGLFLDKFIMESAKNDKLYWLDFKNLNSDNFENARIKILEIVDKHGLKPGQFIIESTQIHLLGTYKDLGFKTSYYLPDDIAASLSEIKKNLEANPFTNISTNSRNIKILRAEFPRNPRYLWLMAELDSIKGIKNRLYLYSILMDPKVEVLLVK